MKNKMNLRKLSAIGISALMAFSITCGAAFSDIALNGSEKTETAIGSGGQIVEGGGYR